MNWMVRMTAELEVSMNSVERVVEYEPMDAEAPAVIEGHRPPPGWPSQGAISVEGLVVRYRPELPPVINGLTFATKAKEKVRAVLCDGTPKRQLSFIMAAVTGVSRWLGQVNESEQVRLQCLVAVVYESSQAGPMGGVSCKPLG